MGSQIALDSFSDTESEKCFPCRGEFSDSGGCLMAGGEMSEGFVPADVGFVDLADAAGGGVVAAEVPVAGMAGDGAVQSVECLVDDAYFGFQRVAGGVGEQFDDGF